MCVSLTTGPHCLAQLSICLCVHQLLLAFLVAVFSRTGRPDDVTVCEEMKYPLYADLIAGEVRRYETNRSSKW